MIHTKDLKTLNLKPGFSLSELKSAFRTRVKECHPDTDSSNNALHHEFLIVKEAYERLLEAKIALQKNTYTKNRSNASTGSQYSYTTKANTSSDYGSSQAQEKNKKQKVVHSESYKKALKSLEEFNKINSGRASELSELEKRIKETGSMVDLTAFLKLIDTMLRHANTCLELLKKAQSEGESSSGLEDKIMSMQKQISRCKSLRKKYS